MNPFVVGVLVALNNVPEKDRGNVGYALMLYFAVLAVVIGGMAAIFALLGV